MSTNMKNNISLKNKIRRRDDSVGEESILLAPGHSTPKRERSKTILPESEDVSSSIRRDSPIQMTQCGVNDVAWDWRSPGTKRNNAKSKEMKCAETPQRVRNTHKKRHSNSPLVYKPLKRKLITKDNTNSVNSFQAELQALSNQLKPDQNEITTDELDSDIDNFDAEIVKDFEDLDDFRESSIVITDSDGACASRNNENNIGKENGENLFDDSIDECMMRCSQEVEEKLKLEEDKIIGVLPNCNKYPTNSNLMSKVSKSSLKTVNPLPHNVMSSINMNSHRGLSNESLKPSEGKDEFKMKQPQVYKPRVLMNSHPKLVPSTSNKASIPSSLNSSLEMSHRQSEKLATPKRSIWRTRSCFNTSSEFADCKLETSIDRKTLRTSEKKSTVRNYDLDFIDTYDDSFDEIVASCVIQPLRSDKTDSNLYTKKLNNFQGKSSLFQSKNHVKTPQKSHPDAVESKGNSRWNISRTKALSDSNIGSNETKFSHQRTDNTFKKTDIHPVERKIVASSRTLGGESFVNNEKSNHVAVRQSSYNGGMHNFNGSKSKETLKIVASGTQCTPEEIERKRAEARERLEAKKKSTQ